MELISREAVKEKFPLMENGFGLINERLHKGIDDLPSAFEGMTNGEILEALFSTDGVYKDVDFVEFVFKGEIHTTYFTRDFWDSPYKGVSE